MLILSACATIVTVGLVYRATTPLRLAEHVGLGTSGHGARVWHDLAQTAPDGARQSAMIRTGEKPLGPVLRTGLQGQLIARAGALGALTLPSQAGLSP